MQYVASDSLSVPACTLYTYRLRDREIAGFRRKKKKKKEEEASM